MCNGRVSFINFLRTRHNFIVVPIIGSPSDTGCVRIDAKLLTGRHRKRKPPTGKQRNKISGARSRTFSKSSFVIENTLYTNQRICTPPSSGGTALCAGMRNPTEELGDTHYFSTLANYKVDSDALERTAEYFLATYISIVDTERTTGGRSQAH